MPQFLSLSPPNLGELDSCVHSSRKKKPWKSHGPGVWSPGFKVCLSEFGLPHLKKMGVLNKCLAYHPAILQPKRDKIGQSDLETVCPSTSFRIVIKDSLSELSSESAFSLCLCFSVFNRYFKKDKAVWYFPRQLCKAFVSIRRLKTTEMIFIGGRSIIHELVSLFKCWVSRKTNAVDKVRSKRGQRSVVFKTWACRSLLRVSDRAEPCKKEMKQVGIYLAVSGSHASPALLFPAWVTWLAAWSQRAVKPELPRAASGLTSFGSEGSFSLQVLSEHQADPQPSSKVPHRLPQLPWSLLVP